MKFRTEVDIQEAEKKIQLEDKIFSIGSCFATEISSLLSKGQLQTCHNPLGTIFNPYSIDKGIEILHQNKKYEEKDLVEYRDTYLSLEHHTSFNSGNISETLTKINAAMTQGNEFLTSANWVVITYGSSFVYEFLPKNKKVANCHKIPQKFFEKHLLSRDEINNLMRKSIMKIKDMASDGVQILFTVSPVRHTKDGIMENQRSKAQLISCIHEVIATIENCHYLPIYEIMMDDLRDYRFYKKDMIHPNEQAIEYIFEKFGKAYFPNEVAEFLQENFKIQKALEHRPQNSKSTEYLKFKAKLAEKIKTQQSKVQFPIFK
ncbi:MAG: hypothetical protein CSA38_00690 [Flavobacteriales bacterium]|nr:MAG: hypothetical protein CSA38_00690 [Flavobacteriales bacterium]